MLKLFNAYRQLPFYFKIIIALSLMLFVMSLTQPAFYIDRKEDPNAYCNSLVLFLLGWMSLLGGAIVPFILWLANPLYIVSILLILRKKIGALCTTWSSTILALIFWQLKSIMTSESGCYSHITGRGPGFYLWLASFVVLALGVSLYQCLINRNKEV
jgi:hypothetical protein